VMALLNWLDLVFARPLLARVVRGPSWPDWLRRLLATGYRSSHAKDKWFKFWNRSEMGGEECEVGEADNKMIEWWHGWWYTEEER